MTEHARTAAPGARGAPGGDRPARVKRVVLSVNDQPHAVELPVRTTLAEVLREHLGLTGTKVGCNRAECGSCTVLLDGAAVFACTVLAIEAGGRRIETVEGLERAGVLHPLQQAFIEFDALQCGICIPGMLMSVKGLLDRTLEPTADDVNQAIAGNLCRCGTYPNTVKATLAAARVLREARARTGGEAGRGRVADG
jgi:carbon-monoxide dehydrogenase small subunit/xanthine dehydrogenase YagT iron-sulfur-binding subunit